MPRKMPTRALTAAWENWKGSCRSTKRNSATANIRAAKISMQWAASARQEQKRQKRAENRERSENSMKLKDFIISEAIVPELKANDRDSALRELAESLASAGALPRDAVEEIVAALVKREQNGSTGFGKGVAVPHVKHPKVKRMSGTIGRSAHGIDFAALDHQPVYSIVLLLSPENEPQQHLSA